MFRDPCETRVFERPVCWGEGERLVCYGNRVLLARSCVRRVREHVTTVCSDFIGCMGGGYLRVVFRNSELAAEVIEAQCTYGSLNDMGRCKQSTCDPRRRWGGIDWAVSLPGVGDRHVVVDRGSSRSTAAAHTESTNNHVID